MIDAKKFKKKAKKVVYTRFMKWDKDAIFKALANSTRRLIIDELCERNEMTLYELSITRQAIAKHLVVLEGTGLVTFMRKGNYRIVMFYNEPLIERVGRIILRT